MKTVKPIYLFAMMAVVLVIIGMFQSWQLALTIVNLCLISSIMALGVNMQWGYAGLFNVGIMGFAALGGMAHQAACRKPVLEMLEWLESMFSPDRPESDQVDLAIQNGAGGSHLTHSHSTQYQFVRQSLMLWAEIQKDIFRLWVAADA